MVFVALRGWGWTQRVETAGGLGEIGAGLFNRSEGEIEFLIHLMALPLLGLQTTEDFKVPIQIILRDGEFLDELLRAVEFSFDAGGSAAHLFQQLALASGEALLLLANEFELLLLALNLLLTKAEVEEFFLGLFHLGLHFFHGSRSAAGQEFIGLFENQQIGIGFFFGRGRSGKRGGFSSHREELVNSSEISDFTEVIQIFYLFLC